MNPILGQRKSRGCTRRASERGTKTCQTQTWHTAEKFPPDGSQATIHDSPRDVNAGTTNCAHQLARRIFERAHGGIVVTFTRKRLGCLAL